MWDYFMHPNIKAKNPASKGLMERRTVHIDTIISCGKEVSEVLLELEDESDGIIRQEPEEVWHHHGKEHASQGLAQMIKAHGVRRVAEKVDGTIEREIRRVMKGERSPRPQTEAKIKAALRLLDADTPTG